MSWKKEAEGSRDGKVIGHTKSGKPIYEGSPSNHVEHYKTFTKEDHRDAEKLFIDKYHKADNIHDKAAFKENAQQHDRLHDKKKNEGKHPEIIREEKRQKEQQFLDKQYGNR